MPNPFSEYYLPATLDVRARSAEAEVVVIGVGSNLGDSVALARAGIERLGEFARGEVRSSSLWRTSPVDCPPGAGDFINAVVVFEPLPGLTPETLLDGLKTIERQFGRALAPVRNTPRELDLDLLLFGSERRAGERLTLPHPRAAGRRFVLAPAAEIVPDLVWPGSGTTVADLLAGLADEDHAERLQGA